MSLSFPGSVGLHTEAVWGLDVCSFCSECALLGFEDTVRCWQLKGVWVSASHCSSIASHSCVSLPQPTMTGRPADHSLAEQGGGMRQSHMGEKEKSEPTEEREQMKEREMPAEGVSQGGGRQDSKQPAGDKVGREEAGFLNTGRKKMEQVGRGLERGEGKEKERVTEVKPRRR